MASHAGRRLRGRDPDEPDSRPDTLSSTAPNDSKRRKRVSSTLDDSTDEEPVYPPSAVVASQAVPSTAAPANGTAGDGAYQPGAIVRVRLTNFVTYTSAEFFPGPNLNMVIGPNGTGKSTLVCAICLGLGWGTTFLGRAKDVSEFVKNGCDAATIEIELQRKPPSRKNPTITRVIKKQGNKSTFSLNGAASTAKALQVLCNSLNIQIDNLCQFLPQDKVVEFAQMSPVQLLESTQRAVSGSEMTKMHDDLRKVRSAQTDALGQYKADQNHLSHLENRQGLQRNEVERMRERALVQRQLAWLEECRPLARYVESKRKFQEAKQQAKTLTRELRYLRASTGPILKNLEDKERYGRQAADHFTRCKEQLAAGGRACDREKRAFDAAQAAIDDLDSRMEAEREAVRDTKKKLLQTQQKIASLQKQKERPPKEFDSRAINAAIQDLKADKRSLEADQERSKTRVSELHAQGRAKNAEIVAKTKAVEALETKAGQQENKLNKLSRDTYTAWKWIEDNRDQFSGPVFGPPMLECSLKDLQMADAVESLLQENDFKIITVQSQQDFLTLQQKLFREKKLHDVSLRVCTTDRLDAFPPPLSTEDMHRFGLTGWALHQLDGPATVLAMLCLERTLHRCAVSSGPLSQQQHDDLAKTNVQSYVSGNKCYQFIRRAEYGAAGTSTRARDVRPARYWTDQPTDMGGKAALERELSKITAENEKIKAEFDKEKKRTADINVQIGNVEAQIMAQTLERDTKQHALIEYRALDASIKTQEDVLAQHQAGIDGFKSRQRALNEDQDTAFLVKGEALLRFVATARDTKTHLSQLLLAEVIHVEAQSDLQELRIQNDHILQAVAEKEEDQRRAQAVVKEEHARCLEVHRVVTNLSTEANRQADEGKPGLQAVVERVSTRLQTEEALQAEIEAEQAKLELTEGGNAGVVAEYEERAKTIQRLRTKVQEGQARYDDCTHAVREIRTRWEPRLEEIVAQINDAFADSFARIGCAGQVAVHKASSDDAADCTEENGGADNGLDFANWAIHVSVKFREHEPLTLLDSHRQSGGERAVSTIFYLMALQSLSRAPFRVVDEINQGMDPRNERMVHGRMVDMATEHGRGQYFLISPKLLSGLKYRRGMTVLCIVSGENVPAAQETDEDGQQAAGHRIDFRLFVQRAKSLGWKPSHRPATGSEGSGGGLDNVGGLQIAAAVGAS